MLCSYLKVVAYDVLDGLRMDGRSDLRRVINIYPVYSNNHFFSAALLIVVRGVTLSDLLDKPQAVVASVFPPSPGTCLHFHRA